MEFPLPPPDADFYAPKRETNCDHNRFTVAEMRYNCRLTESRRLDAAENAKPTPIRNGFAKLFQILS